MKIFIAMGAEEYHLLAYAAKALARSEELGKMLTALKTMSDRQWQLDVELKDPAFARTYRSVFGSARMVHDSIAELAKKYPRIKVLKLFGHDAATLICNYAVGPSHYEPSEGWLKDALKYKDPMSTSSVAETILVPRTEYDHQCPHCQKIIGEKQVALIDGQLCCSCGGPIVFNKGR